VLVEHLGDQISAVSGPAIEQNSLLDCDVWPESGEEWDFLTVDKNLQVVHVCGPRFTAMLQTPHALRTSCGQPLRDLMPVGVSNLLCPLIEVCLEQATGVQQLHTLYRGQLLTLFAYPMISTAKTAVGVQLIYRPTTRSNAGVRNLLVAPTVSSNV
jgi:hypothetical protein